MSENMLYFIFERQRIRLARKKKKQIANFLEFGHCVNKKIIEYIKKSELTIFIRSMFINVKILKCEIFLHEPPSSV